MQAYPFPGEDPRLVEMARRSFDEVDTNRSQTIDINELRRALSKFAYYYGSQPPRGREVYDSFDFLDKNHDGQIVFSEYLRYIKLVYGAGSQQPPYGGQPYPGQQPPYGGQPYPGQQPPYGGQQPPYGGQAYGSYGKY